MQFSQSFFDLRVHFECGGDITKFLSAYQDSAGVWTIGLGTTFYPDGTHVQPGDTCTEEQAYQYAAAATQRIASALAPISGNLNQGNFDALGDFCYNAGSQAFLSSTLRKLVTSSPKDYAAITSAFEAWDKAHVDGELVVVPGLLRRRKCEAYLYQNGVNHPTFFE